MSETDDGRGPNLPDGVEQFEEVVTNSVEEEYSSHGNLTSIIVTATYQRGTRDTEGAGGKHVDAETTTIAVYRHMDGAAQLVGFYPDTTKTGQRLYRETLKALRVLPHADGVASKRLPEDATLEPSTHVVMDLLDEDE